MSGVFAYLLEKYIIFWQSVNLLRVFFSAKSLFCGRFSFLLEVFDHSQKQIFFSEK
jgi:hypothetical protein